MRKKMLMMLVIATLAVSANLVFAEEIENESKTSESQQKTTWQEKQNEIAKKREELKAEREKIQAEKMEAIEEKKVEMQEKKEELAEQRCARIQEKVTQRVENLELRRGTHMAVYKNMADRISKFIERLSEQGYDVAKIEADLEVLNEKIQKFSTDFSAQTKKLDETKNLTCGHSDGEFKNALAESRKMLSIVHTDALGIRNYMLTTVRLDIQALKKQKKEIKASVNDTDNVESE